MTLCRSGSDFPFPLSFNSLELFYSIPKSSQFCQIVFPWCSSFLAPVSRDHGLDAPCGPFAVGCAARHPPDEIKTCACGKALCECVRCECECSTSNRKLWSGFWLMLIVLWHWSSLWNEDTGDLWWIKGRFPSLAGCFRFAKLFCLRQFRHERPLVWLLCQPLQPGSQPLNGFRSSFFVLLATSVQHLRGASIIQKELSVSTLAFTRCSDDLSWTLWCVCVCTAFSLTSVVYGLCSWHQRGIQVYLHLCAIHWACFLGSSQAENLFV